jgi:hypothetical protein
MKQTKFTSFLVAALALLVCSCNSNSSYTPEDDPLFDIVTYVAVSENGSSFQAQKSDISLPVTLTCTEKLDTAQLGKRVLIAYRLPTGVEQYTTSSITLLAAQKIVNDTVTVAEYSSFVDQTQDVVIANLIGNYLDIKTQCSVKSEPATLKLVLDPATATDEVPTLHLVFQTDNQLNSSQKDVYASFDISDLRNNLSYSGFKLVWLPKTAASNGSHTFSFNRAVQITPAN